MPKSIIPVIAQATLCPAIVVAGATLSCIALEVGDGSRDVLGPRMEVG